VGPEVAMGRNGPGEMYTIASLTIRDSNVYRIQAFVISNIVSAPEISQGIHVLNSATLRMFLLLSPMVMNILCCGFSLQHFHAGKSYYDQNDPTHNFHAEAYKAASSTISTHLPVFP
jgi:hypothetical protein